MSVVNSNILKLMGAGEKSIPTTPGQIVKERLLDGEYYVPNSGQAARPAGYIYEGTFSVGGSRGGGHGYGDALERDPQAVVNDVRDEIISEWVALNVYHVAYDADTWTADEEKTLELRRKAREERIRLGTGYSEFETEWLKMKPPEETLTSYGSWPDAKVVRPIVRV